MLVVEKKKKKKEVNECRVYLRRRMYAGRQAGRYVEQSSHLEQTEYVVQSRGRPARVCVCRGS